MNDEIHFGDIHQAAPQPALRPDENRHYAVAAYGEPNDGELPIFVDLDVLIEMEQHALSDTSVELGGVLLGCCYKDARGYPFVVITDSLRAQHYESTKGSFKFTHDTWSAITHERQQFPLELQMVGWYHTHPGWGVFLSGMDTFICDNFFNKQLDVAYVIDPCRGDRGMFQWTDDTSRQTRRTGGFFVTASRFRATELEYYVSELSTAMPSTEIRSAAGSTSMPIVHLHQPQQPTPPWQAIATFAALTIQFLLVALIGWKVVVPPANADSVADGKVAAALEKLGTAITTLEARRNADLAEQRTKARTEFLDAAFRELKGADDGAISRLQSRFDQTTRLSEDVAARDAEIRELRGSIGDAHNKLLAIEVNSKREEGRLSALADKLKAENSQLQAELKTKTDQLAAASSASAPPADHSQWLGWWWTAGGALAVAAIVAGIWWFGSRGGMPLIAGHSSVIPKEVSIANNLDR